MVLLLSSSNVATERDLIKQLALFSGKSEQLERIPYLVIQFILTGVIPFSTEGVDARPGFSEPSVHGRGGQYGSTNSWQDSSKRSEFRNARHICFVD